MDAKTTTLEKQRAAAAALGVKPVEPAADKAAKKPAVKKAAKKVAKKPTKKPAKKAAKKAAKKGKVKPVGARIKVINGTEKKVQAPKAPKAPKPAKAKVPSKSGQSAAAISLERSRLNANEEKVLEALRVSRAPLSLVELAKVAFPRKTRAQGNSWVRNAMRRLVRAALVQKVERGTYTATPKGLGEDQVRPLVLAESPQKADPQVPEESPQKADPPESPSPSASAESETAP